MSIVYHFTSRTLDNNKNLHIVYIMWPLSQQFLRYSVQGFLRDPLLLITFSIKSWGYIEMLTTFAYYASIHSAKREHAAQLPDVNPSIPTTSFLFCSLIVKLITGPRRKFYRNLSSLQIAKNTLRPLATLKCASWLYTREHSLFLWINYLFISVRWRNVDAFCGLEPRKSPPFSPWLNRKSIY